MAQTSPRSTTVTRMDDTANLRAMQKTPPSTIPSGKAGAGSDVGGKAVAGTVQKPSQVPSGRAGSGSDVGGLGIGSTKPVALPSGRAGNGTSAGGMTPSDAKTPPSRIPGK